MTQTSSMKTMSGLYSQRLHVAQPRNRMHLQNALGPKSTMFRTPRRHFLPIQTSKKWDGSPIPNSSHTRPSTSKDDSRPPATLHSKKMKRFGGFAREVKHWRGGEVSIRCLCTEEHVEEGARVVRWRTWRS